ncbi:WD40 repeat domain-containing protein [Lusitaniella coriacea]|uniref:WD40 repeat domain-containing protein n=1 Tax=Lusitaniella coriacea TaxID=1983105 RepID=UPI003CF1FDE7
MFGVGTKGKVLFQQQWQGSLTEYVTAVAWSPNGLLAASSAAGEVVLWQNGSLINLLSAGVTSIDCLAFSVDGKFLAAGGQDGKVRVWSMASFEFRGIIEGYPDLIASLDNAPSWVDKLAWSPTCNHLAFSLGRYVQIWDADAQTVITTLPFANSSVLDLAWRPNGKSIAIAGNGGVKVWSTKDGDDDPYLIDMPSASIVTAWSGDSKYIASGNFDNTITVLKYGNPHPWVMRGFPGKISNLTWSQQGWSNVPLLAASSVEGIAVWKKEADDKDGWNANVLTLHDSKIQALLFHPHSLLLASAGDDGWLGLWTKAKQVGQILEGASGGFSCLAWSQDGKQLAAGGQNGELIIWSKSKRGKGFG